MSDVFRKQDIFLPYKAMRLIILILDSLTMLVALNIIMLGIILRARFVFKVIISFNILLCSNRGTFRLCSYHLNYWGSITKLISRFDNPIKISSINKYFIFISVNLLIVQNLCNESSNTYRNNLFGQQWFLNWKSISHKLLITC